MVRTTLDVISWGFGGNKVNRLGNLREVGYKFLSRVGERSDRQKRETDRTIFHRSLVADFLKRLQGGQ